MQQTSIWQKKKKNMGFRVSYAHALTPVERGLGLFRQDPGPMNVTIGRKKFFSSLKFAYNLDWA